MSLCERHSVTEPCAICMTMDRPPASDWEAKARDAYSLAGESVPRGNRPPPRSERNKRIMEASDRNWRVRGHGPSSEPRAYADELLRDLVQHWDAGDIDHDYDAITGAFDAAREYVRANVGLTGEHRHPVLDEVGVAGLTGEES